MCSIRAKTRTLPYEKQLQHEASLRNVQNFRLCLHTYCVSTPLSLRYQYSLTKINVKMPQHKISLEGWIVERNRRCAHGFIALDAHR